LVLYLNHLDWWAFGVLAFSGLTDMLDGFIARHFNQITDCGKLLDPISDKLTQVAVLVALATRYRELLPLVILCAVKETCQAVGGVIMLKRGDSVQGSLWFGKLSTIVFYLCMLVLVVSTLFDVTLSPNMRWLVSALAGLCMLVAFVGYLRVFIFASRKEESVSDETEKG
jgi:cardiolipin synthase